jgi:hypothetical protein
MTPSPSEPSELPDEDMPRGQPTGVTDGETGDFVNDLSGANLSRANLSWADLSWADLSGANLRGADLSEARVQVGNVVRSNAP